MENNKLFNQILIFLIKLIRISFSYQICILLFFCWELHWILECWFRNEWNLILLLYFTVTILCLMGNWLGINCWCYCYLFMVSFILYFIVVSILVKPIVLVIVIEWVMEFINRLIFVKKVLILLELFDSVNCCHCYLIPLILPIH